MSQPESTPSHLESDPIAQAQADASPTMDALEHLRRRNEPARTSPENSEHLSPPLDLAQTPSQADALARLKRLNENLRSRSGPDTLPVNLPMETSRSDAPSSGWRTALPSGRIAKSALALVAAVAVAWVPVQRLLATTSADATINARLINLRAPIDGKVSLAASSIAVGTPVTPGEPLLHITNARADRQRLDDMRRTLSNLQTDVAAKGNQLERLKDIEANAKAQRDAFQQGRILQLETRQAELAAQLKAAEAHREDALKSLNRSKNLNERGYQTIATLLHAERDYKVSLTEVDAARERLQGNKIELDAARKGLFVGDSYNDLPRSAQRLDELNQQIADLSSEIEQGRARISHLKSEIAAETQLFDSRSSADVIATVDGRIWETLTANGEEVRSGQDLMRVLDCGSATVTATVSEPVYNTLWIGQPVTFQLRGESGSYPGSIAALTGLAAAGSNFAIKQTALKREPYHVTIAVPELAAQQRCNVGRSGQVTFNTSGKPAQSVPDTLKSMEPIEPEVSTTAAPPMASSTRYNLAGLLRSTLESFANGLGYP